MQFRSSRISISVVESFWKFAQSTAVILPCSVQNFKRCKFGVQWHIQLKIYPCTDTLFIGGSRCVDLPKILSYELNVNIPFTGVTCQRWDSQSPKSHPYTDPAMFPHDATIADAANYCRNPDGNPLPWCYVENFADIIWIYCSKSILNCGELAVPSPLVSLLLINFIEWGSLLRMKPERHNTHELSFAFYKKQNVKCHVQCINEK